VAWLGLATVPRAALAALQEAVLVLTVLVALLVRDW
jgi:hypothetical protein